MCVSVCVVRLPGENVKELYIFTLWWFTNKYKDKRHHESYSKSTGLCLRTSARKITVSHYLRKRLKKNYVRWMKSIKMTGDDWFIRNVSCNDVIVCSHQVSVFFCRLGKWCLWYFTFIMADKCADTAAKPCLNFEQNFKQEIHTHNITFSWHCKFLTRRKVEINQIYWKSKL